MVRTPQEAAAKWQRRVAAADADYRAGVQKPRRDWATAALASEQAYADGVMRAIQSGARAAGIQAVGTQKWQANTVAKAGRWIEDRGNKYMAYSL